jgi:transcriptional regulator with XRE-family HTH domain
MELRRIRDRLGLSSYEAARLLSRSQSSLSRLETGHRGVRKAGLDYILDKYGVRDSQLRDRLFRLLGDPQEHGWWESYGDDLSPDVMEFVALESEATFIGYFELILIPGPLQIEEYAKAILRHGKFADDTRMLDRMVDVRMRRRQILSCDRPPKIHVILDEAVLHRAIGGADAHRRQLRFLREVAEFEHVTLQVIPFATGPHPGVSGSFCLLDIGTHDDLRIVTSDSMTEITYRETDSQLQHYAAAFERMKDTALPERDSHSMLERLFSYP